MVERRGGRMSEYHYKEALKCEMIEKLKEHVKEWRANGGCGGDDHMYDLEMWVHEIWGDEE